MAKAAKKAGKSSRKSKRKGGESDGEHLRQLAPPTVVKGFIRDVMAAKAKTSEVGQTMSTATRRAADAGLNVPAARIAVRFISKAKQDPIVARVLLEDVQYYLEVMDFDRLAPPGMFTAEESGQRAPRKPREPKQTEMPMGEQTGQTEPTTQAAPEQAEPPITLQ